jgi:DNA-binding NarL/FixJ family response regulator
VVRVLLIDDIASFRALLRYVLPEDGDVEVVGEAEGLEDGLAAAAALRPDVVLTDVHLGGGSVLGSVPALREAAGGARVLLLSGLQVDELASLAAGAGADGFVEKAADPAALRAAVRGGTA